MSQSSSFAVLFVLWLLLAGPVWAVAGAVMLPRRYRERGLDYQQAALAGGLWGAAAGCVAVPLLYARTPSLTSRRDAALPLAAVAAQLLGLFALYDPHNPCLRDLGYLLNQVLTGLTVGMVYATMAVGLTLIYSVQRIISFMHGQTVMLGAVLAFLLLGQWNVNAVGVIPVVGVAALAFGMVSHATLLAPMHKSAIERPDEYALLVTFGLGVFIQYALVGLLGSPSGIRAPRYTDRPLLGLDDSVVQWGLFRIRTDLLIAGVIGLVLFAGLTLLLYRTWVGKSFRAVAQNPGAAAVAGINASHTFALAFGIGAMLAAMSGAALVPAMNFPVPEMATQAAVRSYVAIVLGGLGSVPGALAGGLVLGTAEALTAACHPDPSKGAVYQLAAGLLIFAAVLLIRPQGLFGGNA